MQSQIKPPNILLDYNIDAQVEACLTVVLEIQAKVVLTCEGSESLAQAILDQAELDEPDILRLFQGLCGSNSPELVELGHKLQRGAQFIRAKRLKQ